MEVYGSIIRTIGILVVRSSANRAAYEDIVDRIRDAIDLWNPPASAVRPR